PDRHRALALTMKAELADIGDFAVRAGLHEVKEASDRAIKLVEAVQDPLGGNKADDYVVLCRGLGHIRRALVSGGGTNGMGVVAHAREGTATVAVGDALTALRHLRERRDGSGGSAGHLLQTVIDEVEKLRKSKIEQCGMTFLHKLLDECVKREAEFAELAGAQIPAVIEALEPLRKETGWSEQLPELAKQAGRLLSSAKQVNAPHATCLEGLLSFLTIVAQRRVPVAVSRYEAVQRRLRECLKAISVWVEEGLAECTAIGGLFGIQVKPHRAMCRSVVVPSVEPHMVSKASPAE
ncbi:MAG: hypothetical protein NZM29_00780, partial [Nitrospira sp.]|nr:hypothetical protein [Nitrospira sp.]